MDHLAESREQTRAKLIKSRTPTTDAYILPENARELVEIHNLWTYERPSARKSIISRDRFNPDDVSEELSPKHPYNRHRYPFSVPPDIDQRAVHVGGLVTLLSPDYFGERPVAAIMAILRGTMQDPRFYVLRKSDGSFAIKREDEVEELRDFDKEWHVRDAFELAEKFLLQTQHAGLDALKWDGGAMNSQITIGPMPPDFQWKIWRLPTHIDWSQWVIPRAFNEEDDPFSFDAGAAPRFIHSEQAFRPHYMPGDIVHMQGGVFPQPGQLEPLQLPTCAVCVVAFLGCPFIKDNVYVVATRSFERYVVEHSMLWPYANLPSVAGDDGRAPALTYLLEPPDVYAPESERRELFDDEAFERQLKKARSVMEESSLSSELEAALAKASARAGPA